MEQIGLTIKAARPAALASLIRILGDFNLAEESVQEATFRALKNWPDKGIPDNAVAWLVSTARRYATDLIRHQNMSERHQQVLGISQEITNLNDDEVENMHLPDDQLRLIFTCCHPALSHEAQVALTLKTIASLSNEEISRAFLLSPKTIEQRLTRAKRKIKQANIPYQVPQPHQLTERLTSVMSVIYLIYNQAYTNACGDELIDKQLAESAIYLTRMLNRLQRNNAEVQGLLALLLLQHSRTSARTSEQGLPVPLEQQDKSLWNLNLINEAQVLIEKSLRHNNPGEYTLQAAISALHCQARQAEDTDWKQIVLLYDLLLALNDNPVIHLNRAVAVARSQNAQTGLQLIEALKQYKGLSEFQYYHSTRANLLEETGAINEALEAYKQALTLCKNSAETLFLQNKIDSLVQRIY